MSLSNLFVGVPQSKYAALAILAAVIVVSFTLLFGKEPIPFTQKMAFVLLVFLISLPGILLTLFQMTCLVTGAGFRNQRWWCSAYSWIVSILLIVYCVMLIVVAIVALTTGEQVLNEVVKSDAEHFTNAMKAANKEAREYFVGEEVKATGPSAAEKKEATPGSIVDVKKAMEKAPAAPKAEPFAVSGAASVPADVQGAAPEPFEDAAMEMFSAY